MIKATLWMWLHTYIPFLLSMGHMKLALATPMLLAAGAVADLAMGGDGAAADDAGVGSEGDEGADADAGDDAAADGADESAAAGDGTAAEGIESADKQDGRLLTADFKKLLGETEKVNPKLAKELKSLYYGQRALRTEFPNGLKEAIALKNAVEEAGGLESITEIQGEVQDYRNLDQQWINGDPAFLETAVTQYPEGFKKLMPAMLQKFQQVDPEAYSRHTVGLVASSLRDCGLSTHLYKIALNLQGETPNAKEALRLLEEVNAWADSLEKSAKESPATPTNDPRNKELEQREAKIKDQEARTFNQNVAQEINTARRSTITAELKNLLKGKDGLLQRVMAPERYEIFEERVFKEIRKGIEGDKAFFDKFERLYNAGDKKALVRFALSRSQALIPKAVQKVYGLLYSDATLGARKPTANGNGNGAGKPNGKAAAPVGWVKLAKPPASEEVNRLHKETDIYSSRAVLKDGRKVTWAN